MKDIEKVWQEKNKNIFKNKLKLDLNNNSDSLYKYINNCLKKIIYNSNNEIKIILDNKKINYSNDSLKKEFRKLYNKLQDISLKETIKRKEQVIKIIEKSDDYLENIDSCSLNFNKSYQEKITKEMLLFESKLKKIYNNIDFLSLINVQIDSLIKKVESEEKFRTNNLKNFYVKSKKYMKNIEEKVLTSD